MENQKIFFKVDDMVCESCEKIIEKSLSQIDGIKHVRASYANGTAEMTINTEKVTAEQITVAIEKAGYHATETEKEETGLKNFASQKSESSGDGKKLFYILAGLTALAFLAVAYMVVSSMVGPLNISVPQLDANTSIALIFLVGLLTGFHCIGMCGGFVLSYTAKSKKENPKGLNLSLHAQYAGGKIISYSVIGGIFGLIGSVFVFTPN